jgi:16S rRNA (guanine527-N7)-methyltransferase
VSHTVTEARLAEAARSIGANLPNGAATRLIEALERLGAARVNVTAITGLEEGVERHVLDSLAALRLPSVRDATRIADVGSGSGFPGIALAAALPDAEVTLIESVGRKAAWLATLSDLFPNISVVQSRSEIVARGPERFDVVVARALAPAPVALELCAPLARVGGQIVLWSGRADSERDARTALAAEHLRLSPCRVVPVEPFPSANRRLLVFDKSEPTPDRYPRRPGRAGSHPIA